ncbi:MAG: SocA family protein [Planctomycetota bacterium]|nr:MAG: SocA family protein [Planctomycetota bacterium]
MGWNLNQKPETWAAAERILLGIIQENGGSFDGRTRLYKAFYDAHLIFWRETGRYLTEHPVVHMPNGPGVDDGASILKGLCDNGKLRFGLRSVGPYSEGVYRLADGEKIELSDEEREAIDGAIAWVGNKTATEISHESHLRSRTWREANQSGRAGAQLHIYLDAVSEEEYDCKMSAFDEARRLLDDALG